MIFEKENPFFINFVFESIACRTETIMISCLVLKDKIHTALVEETGAKLSTVFETCFNNNGSAEDVATYTLKFNQVKNIS